ncbi:hypothetical protein [Bacillus sp. SM2101]|uniref:hypothetical protein n=1 Tax=Bacillus sp. SM2101 TaxID=2805366 RepID=UPI001BDE0414|nr:hypothetical protein [Bacillus sp. SM2101]
MACPAGWNTAEKQGSTFCSGDCGTSRELKWQKYKYYYSDGGVCYADHYVSCC